MATDAVAFRWLFLLTALAGAGYFWVAQHPPMSDLPQHAGQVALLRGFLLGTTPWRGMIVLNLATPYLLGYGLALPLSLLMPVSAALKLLLSLAYLGFVGMCVVLRRHFGADSRLDWLFLPSFLGFATQWGFFTFVVSAPVALLFLLASDVFGQRPSLRRGIQVVAVGLLLLVSHGLVFVFGWITGAGLVVARRWGHRSWLRAVAPYAVLGLAAVSLFWLTRHLQVNVSLHASVRPDIDWDEFVNRVPKTILVYSAAASKQPVPMVATALLVLLPIIMGMRFQWRQPWRWVPLACVLIMMAGLPGNAFAIYFLYQRFALFFLPAWAWAWDVGPRAADRQRMLAGFCLAAIACWSIVGVHALQSWRFDREEADFRHVLAAAQPGQRAMSMVFDRSSDAADSEDAYLQSPLWYQAEKNGLVDFNFAWFAPQIARFAPGQEPPVEEALSRHPETFDWERNRGSTYRYFFVRESPSMPTRLFAQSACPVLPVSRSGRWTLYEASGCK